MQKIGIFLSSHDNVPESFREATTAVGRWIGETRRTLVYGGSRRGMMEVLASTVKSAGGRVYGVVPQIVYERDMVSHHIDVEFRTADLNDRKAILIRESDILMALPGGIGTLDEIFTLLAADMIGTERKMLLLFNVEDCWTPLLEALHRLTECGLVSPKVNDWLKVVESVEEVAEFC